MKEKNKTALLFQVKCTLLFNKHTQILNYSSFIVKKKHEEEKTNQDLSIKRPLLITTKNIFAEIIVICFLPKITFWREKKRMYIFVSVSEFAFFLRFVQIEWEYHYIVLKIQYFTLETFCKNYVLICNEWTKFPSIILWIKLGVNKNTWNNVTIFSTWHSVWSFLAASFNSIHSQFYQLISFFFLLSNCLKASAKELLFHN